MSIEEKIFELQLKNNPLLLNLDHKRGLSKHVNKGTFKYIWSKIKKCVPMRNAEVIPEKPDQQLKDYRRKKNLAKLKSFDELKKHHKWMRQFEYAAMH